MKANEQMWYGGQWIPAGDRELRPVINPANGEAFAYAPEATGADVQAALEAAAAAQPAWAATPPVERAGFLRQIAGLIQQNGDALARLIVREQGKTLFEASGEVGGTAGFFDFFATFARAPSGEILPSDNPDEEIWIRKVPYGVVVALIPWNYPAAVFARKVAPAILAGNSIVVKPHENTPLSALYLARLIEQAGLPPGVVNVVTGGGPTVGDALVRNEITQLVSLTGSVRAGRQVLEAAARNITVVSLELGGKAPFIVLEDADLDSAVQAAVTQRFMNCGQVCTCNERTFVQRSIFDRFLEQYVARVRQLRLGDPMQPGIDVGPKVSQQELEKVEGMVARAREQGARVALGGKRPEGAQFARGFWYEPTVLVDVHPQMEIMREEIFGPVSPIMTFDSFEEAVVLANDSRYGLSAFIFTSDFRRVMKAVNGIQFGEIYVNKIGPEQFQGFHTGWRLSGQGGDDGHHGLEHYYRRQTVYVNYGRLPTGNLMPYPNA